MATKKTTRKTTKKTAKKTGTKKTTKKTTSTATAEKPRTKAQIMNAIADDTGLTKKDVEAVFESMQGMIKKDLGRRGPGSFTVPGLMKIEKRTTPARPARKGVPNPFRPGETMDIPAKRASKTVKVRPLKGLKEMV